MLSSSERAERSSFESVFVFRNIERSEAFSMISRKRSTVENDRSLRTRSRPVQKSLAEHRNNSYRFLFVSMAPRRVRRILSENVDKTQSREERTFFFSHSFVFTRERIVFFSIREYETIDVNRHLHNRGCLDRIDGNVSSNQRAPFADCVS